MTKKITKKDRNLIIAYVIYGIIWFIIHTRCVKVHDDLSWEIITLQTTVRSFSDYIHYYINQLMTWSSRFFNDFVMGIISSLPMMIWRIMDTAIIVFMTIQLDRLLNEKKNIKITLLIMCLCFIYPFNDMVSAGWIATTISYMWPMAFLLYAVRIWRDVCTGREVRKWQILLAGLFYIYALDQQQMAVVALCLCFVMLWVQRKEMKPSSIVITLFTLARILLHLVWPGNILRTASETSSKFPDFDTLSLFDKIQMGVSTTFSKVFLEGHLIFLIVGVCLAIVVFQKYKDLAHRLIALFPNFFFLLWGPVRSLVSNYASGVSGALSSTLYNWDEDYSALYGMVNPDNYFSGKVYVLLFLCGLAAICMVVSVVAIFGINNTGILYTVILIAGFASRFMIGFTPTIYASASRTSIYMYFACIVLIIALVKEMIAEQMKYTNLLMGTSYIVAIVAAWNLYLIIPNLVFDVVLFY